MLSPSHQAVAFAVVCSLYPNPGTVISTEAARAFASSAVEKSASLPPPHLNRDLDFAFTSTFRPPQIRGCPIPGFCDPWERKAAATARVPHPSRLCDGWNKYSRLAMPLLLSFCCCFCCEFERGLPHKQFTDRN